MAAHASDRAQRGPRRLADAVGRAREQARAVTFGGAVRALREAFADNDLLTYASAISFQVFFALIPLGLFVLALLGGSGLEQLYTRDAAPVIRDNVSGPAFQVIDDTVRQVLSGRQAFWLTAGAALALWEISGAMRAVMGVLDRVYGCEGGRSFVRRFGTSLWLSFSVALLFMAALGVVQVLPLLLGDGALGAVVTLLRWPVAVALLLAAVVLVVRMAPSERRDAGWVTLGSALVVGGWVLASLGFGWYITSLADYGSIFGALSVVIVVLTYLYVSSIAFLTGVQLDALIQKRFDGDAG